MTPWIIGLPCQEYYSDQRENVSAGNVVHLLMKCKNHWTSPYLLLCLLSSVHLSTSDRAVLLHPGVPATGRRRGPVSCSWCLLTPCRPWWWTGLPQPSRTRCRFPGISGRRPKGLFDTFDQPQVRAGGSLFRLHLHAAARRLLPWSPGPQEGDRGSEPPGWQGDGGQMMMIMMMVVIWMQHCLVKVKLVSSSHDGFISFPCSPAERARPSQVGPDRRRCWESSGVLQAGCRAARPAGKGRRGTERTGPGWHWGGNDQTAAAGVQGRNHFLLVNNMYVMCVDMSVLKPLYRAAVWCVVDGRKIWFAVVSYIRNSLFLLVPFGLV